MSCRVIDNIKVSWWDVGNLFIRKGEMNELWVIGRLRVLVAVEGENYGFEVRWFGF